MEELMAYMVHYDEKEDGTWEARYPLLPPGVKRHVLYYHDESCFHGYDYKKTIWLDKITDQQKMPGKSKGKLVHCSEFIGLEGVIKINGPNRDEYARKIIYLGSNRDPWWDTKQLLAQLDTTLDIFEKKHLDCITVLVFDQSSAHVSHGDRALNAFAMNLTLGGKNKKPQNNTYFPLECTYPELRGTIQYLYTLDIEGNKVPKGARKILEERGCYVEKTRF
jgi:hypothetical protein